MYLIPLNGPEATTRFVLLTIYRKTPISKECLISLGVWFTGLLRRVLACAGVEEFLELFLRDLQIFGELVGGELAGHARSE